jgi:hypothetical protein
VAPPVAMSVPSARRSLSSRRPARHGSVRTSSPVATSQASEVSGTGMPSQCRCPSRRLRVASPCASGGTPPGTRVRRRRRDQNVRAVCVERQTRMFWTRAADVRRLGEELAVGSNNRRLAVRPHGLTTPAVPIDDVRAARYQATAGRCPRIRQLPPLRLLHPSRPARRASRNPVRRPCPAVLDGRGDCRVARSQARASSAGWREKNGKPIPKAPEIAPRTYSRGKNHPPSRAGRPVRLLLKDRAPPRNEDPSARADPWARRDFSFPV